MDIESIVSNVKELTLDFVNGKRNRKETVLELHKRIDPEEIYAIDSEQPLRDFLTEVYVSLDNLTEEGFAPSFAEMQYFAKCFEGKKTFSQEEVRKFTIGDFESLNPPLREPQKGNHPAD